MDLKKAIQKSHSRAQATKIADYVGNNRSLLKQLVELYLAGPYRITQLASRPLMMCSEKHPGLVKPYLGRILAFLDTPGIPPAVKRNTMRLLQFVSIPERHRGHIVDLCYRYLQDKKEPVAVKVFSISVMRRLTINEPDLTRELRIILEDQLPYSSPAFVSRARKVLKEMSSPFRV